MSNGTETTTVPLRAWIVAGIFLPLAGGYFLSFLFRSINAMIAPHLVAELELSASQLGLMTAAYFLGFGLFQLPLGILLDRFGPARVQSLLLAVAAFGSLLFSYGETFGILTLGRALIGVGVAGGLMSSFTAFTLWLPHRLLPLANGCFMAFGGLGALAATKPVAWALELTDWRGLFFALAVATAVVAVLVGLCLPKFQRRNGTGGFREQLRGLSIIYRSRLFWRVAPLTITTIATGLSVQGLWAGTWLRDVAGLPPSAVANHLTLIAVGLTVGPALSGIVAEAARRNGVSLLSLLGVMAFLYMIVQAMIVLEWTSVSILLWTGFGLLINAMALSYAILSQAFDRSLAGRVNTNLNMLMIAFAFASQYSVGWIIEFWPPAAGGGYAPQAYQVGFGVLLATQIAAFLWFLLARYDTVRSA
jgi:predicted MFS family arabinose efflux permease